MRPRICIWLTVLLATPGAGHAQQPAHQFTYKQTPQGPLALVVDYPADWKAANRRPAIVFFGGGAWMSESIEQFARQAAYLAGRGMVAIRAHYRVAAVHHTEPNAAVEDARTAVRWIRAHASDLGVDPHRIVAAGGSSGGHVTACTVQCLLNAPAGEDTTISSRPDAMVLFNPILDLVTAIRFRPGPAASPSLVMSWEALQRYTTLIADTVLQSHLSPARHVSRGDPPTLVFFGARDLLLLQGRAYVAALVADSVHAELFVADSVSHGFFNMSPWFERTLYRTDEFLASLGYITGPPTIAKP
jgi:acetyl esterase/lipase